jgi:hypothetical protein
VTNLLNTEIAGLDTARLFGWHLTREIPGDSLKAAAKRDSIKIDSLSAVVKRKFDPQPIIDTAFDSLQRELDFQKIVGDQINAAAARIKRNPAVPAADTAKNAKVEKKAADSIEAQLKNPIALLQAKIQSERKKLADSAQSATAALKQLRAAKTAGRERCGCILSPACIPDFFRQFWSGIFGMILTALSISFGAPFWFDLLSSLVKLRGSGASPRLTGVKPEDKKA